MQNEIEKYKEACIKLAQSYRVEVSEHIIQVMTSVCMTRDGHWIGGSFVDAIIKNDLYEAITRADADCLANLRIIVLAKNFCHINN